MKKIQEVVRLRLALGAGVRQIASSCNIGRSTVSEYVARIESARLSWPEAESLSEEELKGRLFPARASGNAQKRSSPDWSSVRRELSRKGVTLKLLWEEYQRAEADAYSYSRYARMYREWLKTSELRMVQSHRSGEKLFVDWAGLKIRTVDPATGTVEENSLFVSAMGSSQYVFAKAYPNEQSEQWLCAHVAAFEFYGALPEMVVPDNLKTGVEKSCRYEPELNLAYAELARFYGVAVVPARVRKPRDKAKVENAVQQVERWILAPLRERTFFSLAEANEAIAKLLAELNEKVMKGPGLSRRGLFEREDLPAMRKLPETRYGFAKWKRAKVAPDYHVEVDGHLYSVPFPLVGKQVDVRISVDTVEAFHAGKRVASHPRSISRRGATTLDLHMPEGHRQQAEWTPQRMVRWAETIGPNVAAFAEALLARKVHTEHGYRPLLGTLRLEKQFGKERLDAACKRAVSRGALSYKSVRSILDKNLETAPDPVSSPPLPSHDNIRGGPFFAQMEDSCAN